MTRENDPIRPGETVSEESARLFDGTATTTTTAPPEPEPEEPADVDDDEEEEGS